MVAEYASQPVAVSGAAPVNRVRRAERRIWSATDIPLSSREIHVVPYSRTAAIALTAVAALAFSVPSSADDISAEQLVDALNGVFGKHAGMRASHARGTCVKGTFTPADGAGDLSKSPLFAKQAPVLGRFSFGGGNPTASEKARSPRGLALRVDPEGDTPTDFAMLSVPIFFANTPEQVVGFLDVRKPVADGKPDAAKVKAFSEANPETTRQAAYVAGQPIPASYAGLTYHSIHAYQAVNSAGDTAKVKFQFVPTVGNLGLSDDEAAAKPDGFFDADLTGRLAAGPIGFELVAIIGEAGDPTSDLTVEWPVAERRQVKLGALSIEALENDAVCDATTFDPNNMADGLAGSPDDLILPARGPSYAVSLSRRSE
jgi:catalase